MKCCKGFTERSGKKVRIVEVVVAHRVPAKVLVDDDTITFRGQGCAVDSRDIEGDFLRVFCFRQPGEDA